MAPRVAGRRSRDPERLPATAVPGPAAAPELVGEPGGSTASEPDLLVCGRIGKPQGLRGEVTVEVRTDVPEERFADGVPSLREAERLVVRGDWEFGADVAVVGEVEVGEDGSSGRIEPGTRLG